MSTISASTTTTTAFGVTADTTGALVFQTGASPTTALTLSSAQVVTLANSLPEASGGTGTNTGYYGFKNRIINGAMVIDQRNAGAQMSGSIAGSYTLDRWLYDATQNSKVTIQQNAGSVTPPVGFLNYLGVTSTSAYSIGAGDLFNIAQYIEGFNTSDLAWGTANAATVTLSFRVYSSLTGTFGGALQNNARTQSYPFTYSIPVANTWTTISVTIAGSTTGTWVGATNGRGLSVFLGLGVGSTYSASAGSWASGDYRGATGATSVVGTNGATFYITGVQLEKGSTATSFDYRPYGTELNLCYRYYYSMFYGASSSSTYVLGTACAYNGAIGIATIQFPVSMRTNPALYQTSGTGYFRFTGQATNVTFDSLALNNPANCNTADITNNTSVSITQGSAYILRVASTSATVAFGAEL